MSQKPQQAHTFVFLAIIIINVKMGIVNIVIVAYAKIEHIYANTKP